MTNTYLQHKDVLKIMTDLILDDGYKSYSQVDEIRKEELTVIAMNILGGDAYTAIIDSYSFDDTLSDLKNFIINGGVDEAVNLADTMRKNAIQYFDDDLSEVFSKLYNQLECEKKQEAGLTPITDSINGETRWLR